MASGYSATEVCTWLIPSSIRLAISISPSRVNSSTVPISRIYIRTGSVVRPSSLSTLTRAWAASSTASSSAVVSDIIRSSASGALSNTWMPISLIMRIISSIWSESIMSCGRWSFTSAKVRYPCSLPFRIRSFNCDWGLCSIETYLPPKLLI